MMLGAVVVCTDHNSIRIQKIGDGAAFAQEFWIDGETKLTGRQTRCLHEFLIDRAIRCAGNDGAFHDDDSISLKPTQTQSDLSRCAADVCQIDSMSVAGCSNSNEYDVCIAQCLIQVASRHKSGLRQSESEELVKSWL